jgi:phosphoglycolate phosphatase-like HAD superfamily hydrolase
MNIAFDLDGCLVDLMSHIQQLVFEIYDGTVIQNGNFDFETEPVLSNRQRSELFHAVYKDWKYTEIYPGVEELFEKLYRYDRKPVHIVTARPYSCAHHTHMLVQRFSKKVPVTIDFANAPFEKLDYLNGTDFFVEDRKSTCRAAAKIGMTVFMPVRPWNENLELHEKIVRINGIEDLNTHINWFIK